jgi:hypothetical protein
MKQIMNPKVEALTYLLSGGEASVVVSIFLLLKK